MAYEMLMQEAQGMSEAALMEVVRFMRFLKGEAAPMLKARRKLGQKSEKPDFTAERSSCLMISMPRLKTSRSICDVLAGYAHVALVLER